MEAGLLNNTGVIIQARMGSKRLPGKVLKPFPFGIGDPLLQVIIQKLLKTFKSNQIFVATSIDIQDDPIFSLCSKMNINCFRGSKNNVLSRFIAIAKNNSRWKYIMRFTADNPFISCEELNAFLTNFSFTEKEYCYSEGLPLGMNFEIVNKKLLLSLENKRLSKLDKEHVTRYIKNKLPEKCIKYSFKSFGNVRCTIDYPQDFLVLSAVQSIINQKNLNDLEGVKEAFESNKWLFSINESLKQLS